MTEKAVIIKNVEGLYARPAAMFVQAAGKFTSRIWIKKDGRKVDAKSIMGLMSLSIGNGMKITIVGEGEDEALAVKELVDLVESDFRE